MLHVFSYHTTVITPLLYSARLGSVGTFHCATMGEEVISWYVNGVPSTYSVIRNWQIITSDRTPINATWSQSSLTVYASQENDGLSIHCVAVVLREPAVGFSETATFHVQENPSPLTNITLQVSENRDKLMLRWNLPSRGRSTIIVYTVYVNIFHTGTEFYINVTTREYTLENPCSDVLFKVTAWDDIGEGNGTTLLYKHHSNGEKSKSLQWYLVPNLPSWPYVTTTIRWMFNHPVQEDFLTSFLKNPWQDLWRLLPCRVN